MKKKFYILLASFLSVFAVVFVLRFVIGGDEDTWICEDGSWVKHGQPVSSPPTTGCGPEKLIGGDKDEHDCLVAAGYTWCQKKEKCLKEWEEPCTQEKAFEILSQLKKQLNISFSGIGNTTFKLFFLSEESKGDGSPLEKEISGKTISHENASNIESEEIENYFEKEKFSIDQYNVANGTFISKVAYKKENITCLITKTTVDYDQKNTSNTPNPLANVNIKIECADIFEI